MLVPRDGLRLNSGPDLVTLLFCFMRLRGERGGSEAVYTPPIVQSEAVYTPPTVAVSQQLTCEMVWLVVVWTCHKLVPGPQSSWQCSVESEDNHTAVASPDEAGTPS